MSRSFDDYLMAMPTRHEYGIHDKPELAQAFRDLLSNGMQFSYSSAYDTGEYLFKMTDMRVPMNTMQTRVPMTASACLDTSLLVEVMRSMRSQIERARSKQSESSSCQGRENLRAIVYCLEKRLDGLLSDYRDVMAKLESSNAVSVTISMDGEVFEFRVFGITTAVVDDLMIDDVLRRFSEWTETARTSRSLALCPRKTQCPTCGGTSDVVSPCALVWKGE